MSLNIAVVMDPIEHIKIKKDSSIAMLWAAAARGHKLWYLEQGDLFVRDGEAVARLTAATKPRKRIDAAALQSLTSIMRPQDSAADLVRSMRDSDRS